MTEPEKEEGAPSGETADKFDSDAVPSTKIDEEANLGGTGKSGRSKDQTQAELSVVSQQYDMGGKGYLTEEEKVMRKYDANNDGQLDMSEIYKIVQDLQRQQKQLNDERAKILNMKRVIIFLCCFTVILALAMLGVSFAAAILAKDTSVNSSTNSLDNKSTGEQLSTVAAGRVAGVATLPENVTDEEPGRRLLSHLSWGANEFRRRRAQEERELFPSMRPRPPGENNDNNNNNNRPNNNWDNNRPNNNWNNNNNNGPSARNSRCANRCSYFQGRGMLLEATIPLEMFRDIRSRFWDNERSTTFRTSDGYSVTIDFSRGFVDPTRNDYCMAFQDRGGSSAETWIFDCWDNYRRRQLQPSMGRSTSNNRGQECDIYSYDYYYHDDRNDYC